MSGEKRPARPSKEADASEPGDAVPIPTLDEQTIAALLDGRSYVIPDDGTPAARGYAAVVGDWGAKLLRLNEVVYP